MFENDAVRVVFVQWVVARYTAPFLERLSEKPGIDLTVLADLEIRHPLNQYDRTRDRFKVEQLGTLRIGSFRYRPGLIAALSKHRPDIVIALSDPHDISLVLALLWCKLRRIRVGVWGMFHKVGCDTLLSRIFARSIGLFANFLLTYGKRGRERLLTLGIPQHKVVNVSTALDENSIAKVRDSITATEIAHFKNDMGINGKHVLLHVVTLHPKVRPDLMLQCFNELLKVRDDTVLVWIGGGPLEDETKSSAAKLGILDKMKFVGPVYDEKTLALWFRSADVFAIAAGIGLSIHHAMCYGLPVVTSDDYESHSTEYELLLDGVNGMTYRHEDSKDFAAKIRHILDDANFRELLSANAKRRIEEEYTLDRKVTRTADAICHFRGDRR